MQILLLLIPLSVFLAALFVLLFIRAARNGQFDDLDDPPQRMLAED